jgi:NADH-quinone oxidoreductase subunit J
MALGHFVLLAATIPDALTFAVSAIICVCGAFGVVLLRNPVHAALSLVATLFGIAVLFVAQDAQFLAAVQVIVYAGAIVVLFLFVIMLLGVDRTEAVFGDRLRGQRYIGVLLGLVVLVELLLLSRSHWQQGAQSVSGKLSGGAANTKDLGESIFTTYLLPFEVTSALLVIAVVGAVVLARRPSEMPVADEDKQAAVDDDGSAVTGEAVPSDVVTSDAVTSEAVTSGAVAGGAADHGEEGS